MASSFLACRERLPPARPPARPHSARIARCGRTRHSAIQWYKRAADQGDKRAAQRLKGPQNTALVAPGGPGSVLHRDENGSGELGAGGGKGGKDKDCVIM